MYFLDHMYIILSRETGAITVVQGKRRLRLWEWRCEREVWEKG